MGAKSSNVVAKQEMLPLFQVLSDLEKPITSSVSLKTNFSSNPGLSTLQSENDKFAPSPCSNTDCDIYYCECCLDREFLENQTIHAVKVTSDKKVTKRRRRLKRQQTVSSSSGVQDHLMQYRKREHRNMPVKEKGKRLSRKKETEFKTNPEIHSSMALDDSFLPEIEPRTGMFTNMTLIANKNKEVGFSKHSSNEELRIEIENASECPIYEVPNDVIGSEDIVHKNKSKKSSKKNKSSSDSLEKFIPKKRGESKISKKSIIKKYESMLKILVEKCQLKDSQILEKNDSLSKMKKKLKQALHYNNQFAEENEYMKSQHDDMKSCIERYKKIVASLEDHQENTQRQTILPGVTNPSEGTCVRCGIIELSAIKIEKENTKLSEDVVMLKNVVFRLNVQLSRYQERVRTIYHSNSKQADGHESIPETKQSTHEASMPSLPTFPTEGKISIDNNVDNGNVINDEESKTHPNPIKYGDSSVWGDVNVHTLAPLLNAYQESLVEKDELIRDYEKEFNRFTSKLKEIVYENNELHTSNARITSELIASRENSGLAITERDELRKENHEIKENLNEVQDKLKGLQESFEQKVQAMSRDYTLIHQEYFKTKTGLAVAQGRCQAFEEQQKTLQGENLIPIKVHSMKIEECRRMFEELKTRYEFDKNKYATKISILEQNVDLLDKKHLDLNNEKHDLEIKIKTSSRVIRKFQNTVAFYRKESAALKSSRDVFKRRAIRATALCRKLALILNDTMGDDRFQHLKTETMAVRKEAMKELEALEARMKEQDVNLAKVKEENEMELMKLEDLIREKDAKIEAMKQHIRGDRLPRYITPN